MFKITNPEWQSYNVEGLDQFFSLDTVPLDDKKSINVSLIFNNNGFEVKMNEQRKYFKSSQDITNYIQNLISSDLTINPSGFPAGSTIQVLYVPFL